MFNRKCTSCATLPSGVLFISTRWTLLIVDDSPTDLELLAEALCDSRDELTYWTAGSPEAAGLAVGEILEARSFPVLLVSDLHLQDQTAIDLGQSVAAILGANLLGLVVLSSSLSRRQAEELVAEGAAGVFEKPIDLASYSVLAATLLELADWLVEQQRLG